MSPSDVATYLLPNRTAAWSFMRAREAAGLQAGFPSLSPGEEAKTVQVGIRTYMDREAADKLAQVAPVVEYRFAGREEVSA